MIRTGASQLVQAASALAVARILAPRSYGLFALALTLVGAVRMVGDLGITYALIVEREVKERDLRIGTAVSLAVAIVGGVVVSLIWMQLHLVNAAGDGAAWMAPALALTLVIGVPAFPATIVLERNLDFSRLGVIGVVQAVTLFGTQVILLLAGVGLWSLVIAYIVGTTLGTCLTVRAGGHLYLPSLRGPVATLVRKGLPYQGSLVATSIASTVTTLVVAAQLGARGVGLLAWCTILATPVTGALLAIHSVGVPALARMRREDSTRYDESVTVVTRTLTTIAAVAAGSFIGLTSPTIRYVFGTRWLPATTAVQICLAGTIPMALVCVLASDANARKRRHLSLLSALAGGGATIASLWPLAAILGVAGAAGAQYLIGPAVTTGVFAWGLRVPIGVTAVRALRLFGPLCAISFALGALVKSPVSFAFAAVAAGLAGLAGAYFAEGALAKRVLPLLRRRSSSPVAVGRDRATIAGDGTDAVGLTKPALPHTFDVSPVETLDQVDPVL